MSRLRRVFTAGVVAGLLMAVEPPDAVEAADDALPATLGTIERFEPEFDELVPAEAVIEVLAGGLAWSEGPVWVPQDGGYLLFSDIPRNHIVQWKPGEGTSIFLERVGYTGEEPFTGPEPGTNGLVLDSQGRLVMCCHGDRSIKRLEHDGSITELVTHYEGRRFNSPNDLVYDSQGNLYFTDPPYGLPQRFNDAGREMDYCGVFRLGPDGEVTLLTADIRAPNGIGLSPDERTLYIAQSDGREPYYFEMPIRDDGSLGDIRLLFDASPWIRRLPGGPDGMAVDEHGNLWATGPGGVLVLSPDGRLLGRIRTDQRTANCTFADDGTLYLTADSFLCRVPTKTRAAR